MNIFKGIAVVALVSVFILDAVGGENNGKAEKRGSFKGGKTMVSRPMHRRGSSASAYMHRDEMMMSLLKNPEFVKKIGLSDKRRDKITSKMEKMKDKNIELKNKMKKAALKQARLMTAKDLDKDALMASVEELGRYRTQMAKQKIGMLILMRETLTSEQLGEIREAMHRRMREHNKETGRNWRRNAKSGAEGWKRMSVERRRNEGKRNEGTHN